MNLEKENDWCTTFEAKPSFEKFMFIETRVMGQKVKLYGITPDQIFGFKKYNLNYLKMKLNNDNNEYIVDKSNFKDAISIKWR